MLPFSRLMSLLKRRRRGGGGGGEGEDIGGRASHQSPGDGDANVHRQQGKVKLNVLKTKAETSLDLPLGIDAAAARCLVTHNTPRSSPWIHPHVKVLLLLLVI